MAQWLGALAALAEDPHLNLHVSFFTFFSDFVIFQVVNWMFLIFHDFQFSCLIPRPTVDIAKFSTFFSFPIPHSEWSRFHFWETLSITAVSPYHTVNTSSTIRRQRGTRS